jgi:S1-C subfamily serine protease
MRRSRLHFVRTMNQFGIAMCLVGSVAAADPPENVSGEYWLGLACEDLSAPLRRQCGLEPGEGLLVFSVAVDGPAATAGLELYDVLLSVDDQQVGSGEGQGLDQVWDGSAAAEVRLEVLRQGRNVVIAVTPQPRPAAAAMARADEPPLHGLQHP